MKIVKITNNFNKTNINKNTKINSVTNPLSRDLSAILPEEIGYLNKIGNFNTFVNEAYKLIKSISPFKEDICPKISIIPMPPYYKAMYFPKNNTISVNGAVGTITKVKMFEVLSHEFKHSEQIYNALRLDKNKEKNLKSLVDFISRADEVAYHDIVTKMSPESINELYKSGLIDDNFHELALEGCRVFDNQRDVYGKYESKVFDEMKNKKLNFWTLLQNNIIADAGLLKADSKTGKKYQKIFDSAMKENKVGLSYFFKPHERDAYSAGFKAAKTYKSLLREHILNNGL